MKYEYNRHINNISSDYTIEFNVKKPDYSNLSDNIIQHEYMFGGFMRQYIKRFKNTLVDKIKDYIQENYEYVNIDDLKIEIISPTIMNGWLVIGLDKINEFKYTERYYNNNKKYILDKKQEYENEAKYNEIGDYIKDFVDFGYGGILKNNSDLFNVIKNLVEEYYNNYNNEIKKYYDIKEMKKTIRTNESNNLDILSKQIDKDINRYKKQLIAKAKKKGLYENFGDDEQRKLEDKYRDFQYKNQYDVWNKVMAFADWCMNFNDSDINENKRQRIVENLSLDVVSAEKHYDILKDVLIKHNGIDGGIYTKTAFDHYDNNNYKYTNDPIYKQMYKVFKHLGYVRLDDIFNIFYAAKEGNDNVVQRDMLYLKKVLNKEQIEYIRNTIYDLFGDDYKETTEKYRKNMKRRKINEASDVNKTTVYFHTGRGGRFNNQGHTTFNGFETIDDIIPSSASVYPANWLAEDGELDMFLEEDWVGLKSKQEELGLDDDDFREKKLDDMGRESIEYVNNGDGTGYINWDHQYDTDNVIFIDDCSEEELLMILKKETKNDTKSYDIEKLWDWIKKYAEENSYYDVLEFIEDFDEEDEEDINESIIYTTINEFKKNKINEAIKMGDGSTKRQVKNI